MSSFQLFECHTKHIREWQIIYEINILSEEHNKLLKIVLPDRMNNPQPYLDFFSNAPLTVGLWNSDSERFADILNLLGSDYYSLIFYFLLLYVQKVQTYNQYVISK